jgi:hypothetical protein
MTSALQTIDKALSILVKMAVIAFVFGPFVAWFIASALSH